METTALFELRSYRAAPGRCDALIDLFESTFLDAYRAGGTQVLGTFRVPEEPDRWVWLRAFPDAASRGERLRRFYEGEVWKTHGAACDALIREIEPALLLREWRPRLRRAAPRAVQSAGTGVYVIDVHPVAPADEAGFAAAPAPRGGQAVATFLTDHSPNTYPRQPTRAGSVFVTLSRFASLADVARTRAPAGAQSRRLVPTARSALR